MISRNCCSAGRFGNEYAGRSEHNADHVVRYGVEPFSFSGNVMQDDPTAPGTRQLCDPAVKFANGRSDTRIEEWSCKLEHLFVVGISIWSVEGRVWIEENGKFEKKQFPSGY